MLLSMTGFGEAHCQQDGLAVAVEVRTINSRFFKLSVRAGEGYGAWEPQIESAVRKSVRRGTIQINLRVVRASSPDDFKLNVDVLDSYRQQLESLNRQWKLPGTVSLENLLLLPGVVDESVDNAVDLQRDWPIVHKTLQEAIESLAHMRAEEGRAMAADLAANCRTAAASLEEIQRRAPLVVDTYRARLEERLKKTLAEYDVVLDPADVIKEVSLFADRGDISEEIVRLRSHLEQFSTIMDLPESSGRKLEFLTQEMLRETNTIGSKANDVEIARQVIEIKAAIERIREMIQNIE
ncbi:hypothetical protein LCGC14_2236420 [marine sediment metagenome]|uniref:YicC family protein n=1 Tax=marine sediment metagenome TaxID=412755 RepID=A0A0F9D6I6_9ZZZZ